MIEKQIDWNGYNVAEIISVNEAGEPLCNLKQVNEEDGWIAKQDNNISFPADNMPFELTADEIEEIKNPVTDANSAVEITPTGE